MLVRKKPVEIHRGACVPRRGYCSPQLDSIPAVSEFTWCFWARLLGRGHGDANILHKGRSSFDHGPTVDLEGRTRSLVVRLDLQSGVLEARTQGALKVDTWTLVVVSVGSTCLRVYLDGRLDVERHLQSHVRPVDGPVWLSSPWYPAAEVRLADVRFIPAECTPADLSVSHPPAGS